MTKWYTGGLESRICRHSMLCVGLFVWISWFTPLSASVPGDRCSECHPKEVAAYRQSAMAHALSRPAAQPIGTFDHPYSRTSFRIFKDDAGLHQAFVRNEDEADQQIAYVIGSGQHAFGYLVQVRDHLFQSPLSYYTQLKSWGMAPGYELDPHPDFSRPVPLACLLCHSGKPEALEGTLNRYKDPVVSAEGITCERCHGQADQHLRNPIPGSIVNPAKLTESRRDSVCEQCHLTGEVRIPNPGKGFGEYVAGNNLEDTYTIYVQAQPTDKQIKVVSHAEQLALSVCARQSSGKLWCGTCHNPHETVARPAEYFRQKCLTCHGSTLEAAHAAEGRNCIGCHMQKKPTSDGGHTTFTDHRIARHPEALGDEAGSSLKPWRESPPRFRERNLGLAMASFATEKQSASQMVEAYRMLSHVEKEFPDDPEVATALGTLLFIAQDVKEAEGYYRKTVALKPEFAPYQVNLGAALLKQGKAAEARQPLEHAFQLDPLLGAGVELLARTYLELGDKTTADAIRASYRHAMGYKH